MSDAIDRLVDDQLQRGQAGYDHSIGLEKCRCGARFHGLPIGGCPGAMTEGPIDDWIGRRTGVDYDRRAS